MDEAGLAARAAAGDAVAFTALVRAHEGVVRRFLRRLGGDHADDLSQDAFVTAWERASVYRGVGSYRNWLLRIAYHKFLDAHRSGQRREAREQATELYGCSIDLDLSLDLARAMAILPARERAAALLCFAEGCSHVEAATIMAMPLGSLKTVLARARNALVQQLGTAHGG